MEELEKTNIRNLLLVALLLMLCGGIYFAFLYSSFQRKDEYIQKSACLESDYLRVQIGGEQFTFPRKIVRSVRGADVRNIENPENTSASGMKACQRVSDPLWLVESIGLDLDPEPCQNGRKCKPTLIDVVLTDLAIRKACDSCADVFPKTESELLEKCYPPLEPYNVWHATYWSTCDFTFEVADLHVWIKFHGGVYPPEAIQQTQALVLELIRSYRIKE